jgi:outer membrane protein insertion porin family
MMIKIINFLKLKFLLIIFFFTTFASAEVVNNIQIIGNDRITKETIVMFSGLSVNDNIESTDVNNILKNLYETNFFKTIEINFKNNIFYITVEEYPVIQNIIYQGIKSNKLMDIIKENQIIKERSSYNEILLENEKDRIISSLRNIGYYNPKLDINVEYLDNNLVDLQLNIQIGKKAKIKKITFIGDKKFKDRKLKRIISSEEYKFWKLISGKKYLNQNLVAFDNRLLKNFYKNNGYYNVDIKSSFAKLTNNDEFELIFNIDAKDKIYFGDLNIDLPIDFNIENFNNILILFDQIKGEPFSIFIIDKILEEIDKVTLLEQYKFIKATVKEEVVDDKINLTFFIKESDKFYVDKINILGNNVTREHVIRNQLEFAEGDPYSEILVNKSINNIKSLNFFKSVNNEIIDGNDFNTKIMNITLEERPTGEISAAAGIGTSGTTIGFGVKENNFMGAGISLDTNFTVSTDSFKGKFAVTNPNFKNSDKSLTVSAEAIEIDNYNTYGYKSNKTGFSFLTNFELYDDLFFGLGNSNFYEKIETNNTASSRQQSQEGDYWDSFLNLDFNYDKRNQKFQTSEGYRSFYSIDLPIISETSTLKNYYNYSYYFDLFEDNISTISLLMETAYSLKNKDVKLSERINIPSSRLRGFQAGRIGPKDGEDYIGGNYAYALNFSSTIPQILEESQNVDFIFFIDAANVGGVDYDSSIDDSGKIRSSTGIGIDWYSPIGPLNFSLATPLSKETSDKTESFRFNLGTTF